LKIIFAREDIIVHKDQLKEKQSFAPLELTVTFLELVNLLIVQFAQLVIIVQTRPWILLLALSVTIVQLA
jgi:hypothetical protein